MVPARSPKPIETPPSPISYESEDEPECEYDPVVSSVCALDLSKKRAAGRRCPDHFHVGVEGYRPVDVRDQLPVLHDDGNHSWYFKKLALSAFQVHLNQKNNPFEFNFFCLFVRSVQP